MNLNRFDLATLRLYVAAVDTGSLTAGAERMGISLAAASKRIAELESHVGAPLLARSKRGVVPTTAGQTLQRHAIDLVARLEQLAVAMEDVGLGSSGQVRLWANTSAFSGFLPELLAAYSAAHPDTRIDLEDAYSDDAVRAVERGVADLAVVGENTPTGALQSLVCDRDELVLLLPAGHALAQSNARVAFSDALGCDFVAMSRATSLMRYISSAAEAAGRTLRIRVQVRSFDAMCRMVAAGIGVAILPRQGAALHATAMGLEIRQLDGVATWRRLMLLMRNRDALSPAARAMVELVEQRMTARPDDGSASAA